MSRGALVWTLFVASAGGFTSCSSDPAPPSAACIAESDQEMCARLALDCGLFVGFDTCGRQRTINCGACASPLICGGSGVPNVCAPSGSGAGGSGGEGGSDGSAGTDGSADAAADAADANPCTFACPTRSHWLTGTFTFDFASLPAPPSTGVLRPLVGQTVSLMISFDQGAQFKDPPESNRYRLRILTTSNDFQSSGDTSGVFKTRIVPHVDGLPGELWLDFGTGLAFTASFTRVSDLAFRIQIRCSSATGLFVGPDQYLIPGPMDCPQASISLVYGDSSAFDQARGQGTFSYR